MQQVEGRPLPVPRRRPGCRPAGVLGSRSQSLKGPQRSPEHHGGLCHTLDCDAITTVPCQVISIQVVVMVQLKLLNIITLFVSSGGCRCKTICSLHGGPSECASAACRRRTWNGDARGSASPASCSWSCKVNDTVRGHQLLHRAGSRQGWQGFQY
jgi:hypothetical protein